MDCHDLIEWLAVQDWCNGKVAMSGTSYLAISQWFTAAEQPPHLGFSDASRDLVKRGGMPDIGFAERLQKNSYAGHNRREDILAETERYPLVNDLWEDKIARFDKITVPAYVVAGYSNTLHTAERGASVLRYKGSNGRLRASARHLDETLTTDAVPAHSFDRVEKPNPGEIVDLQIDLFPIGLVFYPGEPLRLVISARNALGAIMPGTRDHLPRNAGKHVIHTGGQHASYLQLPSKSA